MTDYNHSPGSWADNRIPADDMSHAATDAWTNAFQVDHSHMALAMAYVKWQKWQKPLDCDTGLAKGTIFPELVKPFLGQGRHGR